ncbi:MAG: alanine dehydrogenase [Candidatus Marinarcus sp.]|uniref:alanine dehydrogenase n=1 Tax=Candidatus Marinarcus sp. TaxID=3100987 RepID=UPI003B0054E3
MIIGVPKEIKEQEYRVGLTPKSAKQYIKRNHVVYIQAGAGVGSGFEDNDYIEVGCKIVSSIEEIYAIANMIIKVKEPIPSEYKLLKENQILYTYLHLAANKELTLELMKRRVSAVAYETITNKKGELPCLMPMSEIAGKLSVQEGAKYLEKTFGGKGILLGGVRGVKKANVVILGAGTVGKNACKIAIGFGARVTVLSPTQEKLDLLKQKYEKKIHTKILNKETVLESIKDADLVIGAVLIQGASAPKLITKDELKLMKKNSVIVDVSIDQGGCFETSKPTTHTKPTYVVNDVIHYCVANMPGCVPMTSSQALNKITLKYGLMLASLGLEEAMLNSGLKNGLNVYKGECVNDAVKISLNI